MLFFGPSQFEANVPYDKANTTSVKVCNNIYKIVTTFTTSHDTSDATTTYDPAALLADLPSFQLILTLTELFQDPDKAISRGVFQRISTETIDLPPPRQPVNPSNSTLWTKRLPPFIQHIFCEGAREFFINPLTNFIRTGKETRSLSKPMIHASGDQYLKLLDKLETAGMLHWTRVSQEDPSYKELASDIQMTLFAVSKSSTRSRLISWPRIQNDALPDPPYTSLPDPSLFQAVAVNGSHPSAFYFTAK